MKLYNLPPAPNPRRVRIFLAEKGVEVPTVDIDITKNEHRTPEFLALNPLAALPVLELDDGTVITESIAICRYFEELHPQPPMFGRSTLEHAQVEMWTRRIELGLMRAITDHFVHGNDFWKGRREQIPEYAALARTRALACPLVAGDLERPLVGNESKRPTGQQPGRRQTDARRDGIHPPAHGSPTVE